MMSDTNASHARLQLIPIDRIDRNPENPRIIFRTKELEELTKSIRKYGVQVPISVYKERNRFVLIDGERRWRCSLKLNRSTIPALIQEKPTTLTNLLLMFNIHALREQWDLLTMASKLPVVIELCRSEIGRTPTEAELADRTGLSRSTLRRCKLLIDLPQHHIDRILSELRKPKQEQKLTEDFYIEMERALKTVERAMPDLLPDKEVARSTLIDKFEEGVFVNRTDFRLLAKIARADRVEASSQTARRVLTKVLEPNRYSLERAYEDSVSSAYEERDITTRIDSLLERLSLLKPEEIDDDLQAKLRKLLTVLQALFRGRNAL